MRNSRLLLLLFASLVLTGCQSKVDELGKIVKNVDSVHGKLYLVCLHGETPSGVPLASPEECWRVLEDSREVRDRWRRKLERAVADETG